MGHPVVERTVDLVNRWDQPPFPWNIFRVSQFLLVKVARSSLLELGGSATFYQGTGYRWSAAFG